MHPVHTTRAADRRRFTTQKRPAKNQIVTNELYSNQAGFMEFKGVFCKFGQNIKGFGPPTRQY